jgi:hypothetical protein
MKDAPFLPQLIIPLLLTGLFYWIFLMNSQSVLANLAVVLGITGTVIITFRIYKKKSDLKTIAISLLLGIATIGIISGIVLLGAAIPENHPGYYGYKISVQGLRNYEGGIITTILVPIPVIDGKQAFSDDELLNKTFNNWTSTLVNTNDGKMIAFQTNDRSLTDVDAGFYKWDIENSATRLDPDELLSPHVNDSSTKYTQWIGNNPRIDGYSTIIYVDDTIRTPDDTTDNSIFFNLEFNAGGGLSSGMSRDLYQVFIQEKIPEGVSGPILVRTQIGKKVKGAWMPSLK